MDAESFKKVAVPRLAATMQAVRKRLGAPIHAVENAAVSIEQDIQKKVDGWFSSPEGKLPSKNKTTQGNDPKLNH